MSHKQKVIDTHFHLWNLAEQKLPWLADTDGSITHTYTMSDYLAAYDGLDGLDFLGGVYVEIDGADSYQEDEIVYNISHETDKLLAMCMRSSVSPWMRIPVYAAGVREPLHIPSKKPGRCLEPTFIEGLRELGKAGLVFESCNRVIELENAFAAFSEAPDTTIVLNHLGNVETLSDQWCSIMQRFATLSNLYVKVSGYPTHDYGFVQELLAFVKETFAEDKLLYASNWPVIKLYGNLEEHIGLCMQAFGTNDAFWYKNALKAYGITESQPMHETCRRDCLRKLWWSIRERNDREEEKELRQRQQDK